MKGDPIREALVENLRLLRRLPGPFGQAKITGDMEALLTFVGRGSEELAYTTLLDALARYGTDPEGEIRAYFETAGFDTAGDNLDERLQAYAARHFVVERTGLRRSDRGAGHLADIFRDQMVHDRPWANVFAVQTGAAVVMDIWVELPEGSLWRRPWVYVNDEETERRPWELHQKKGDPTFSTARERFLDLKLNTSADDLTSLLRVNVIWAPQVWPAWQVDVQIADPRIYARFVVDRDNSSEFSIWWANEDAIATRDVPLIERSDWSFGDFRRQTPEG